MHLRNPQKKKKKKKSSVHWQRRGGGLWPTVTFDKSLSLLTSARRALSYRCTWHHMLISSHPTVSSIISLIGVLVLCHFDDSMLICHCRSSERLKEGGWGGRRHILQVRRVRWQCNHRKNLQRDFFFFHAFTRSRPKGVVLVRASSRRA